MADGISRDGRNAEALFLELVAGSTRAASAALGDPVVIVDGQPTTVEVKKCKPKGKSGTINQVRAIKFIPLAVYNPATNCWYVIPATELVRLASAKQRGQHTEISFESMNLSLRQISDWSCSPAQLDDAVRAAIRFDRAQKECRAAMVALLAEIKKLSAERRTAVEKLIQPTAIWRIESAFAVAAGTALSSCDSPSVPASDSDNLYDCLDAMNGISAGLSDMANSKVRSHDSVVPAMLARHGLSE